MVEQCGLPLESPPQFCQQLPRTAVSVVNPKAVTSSRGSLSQRESPPGRLGLTRHDGAQVLSAFQRKRLMTKYKRSCLEYQSHAEDRSGELVQPGGPRSSDTARGRYGVSGISGLVLHPHGRENAAQMMIVIMMVMALVMAMVMVMIMMMIMMMMMTMKAMMAMMMMMRMLMMMMMMLIMLMMLMMLMMLIMLTMVVMMRC